MTWYGFENYDLWLTHSIISTVKWAMFSYWECLICIKFLQLISIPMPAKSFHEYNVSNRKSCHFSWINGRISLEYLKINWNRNFWGWEILSNRESYWKAIQWFDDVFYWNPIVKVQPARTFSQWFELPFGMIVDRLMDQT